MPDQAETARTPGAKRARDGEHHFELAKVNHIKGGPDYSTAVGACIEGDRMMVAPWTMTASDGRAGSGRARGLSVWSGLGRPPR